MEVISFIESNKLRALAVTTRDRSDRLPNIPTIGETLPGFEYVLWNGVFAPANTPSDIVEKLSASILTSLKKPALRDQLLKFGSSPVGNTSSEFKATLDAEIEKSAELVKVSGARLD